MKPISSFKDKSTDNNTCLLIHDNLNINQCYRIQYDEKSTVSTSIIKDLTEELNSILSGRIAIATTDSEKNKIRRDHEFLKNIVLKHPRMFHHAFQAGSLNIPPVVLEFNKNIKDIKPIVSKIKPLSHKEREILHKWWEKGFKEGILEESNSQWRSSAFPVPKSAELDKNGKLIQKWRVVTPFFGLNRLLNLRVSVVPHLWDIRLHVAGSDWFSKLDLAQAFFQIPLAKESRPFTAIGASGVPLSQYKALPMGLAIS